jgi:hypothetical protein
MIPHPFYYQLGVLRPLWLFVPLSLAWPSQCMATMQRPVKPLTPQRKRSHAPTPSAGLTQRPPCAACDHDITQPCLCTTDTPSDFLKRTASVSDCS